MAASFTEVFLGLLNPWQFMLISLSFLPGALLRLIRNFDIATLSSWSAIQDAWFSDFWTLAGQNIRKDNGPRITALFEGRVTCGEVASEPVHAPLSGVVLEVGAGSGYWVDLFTPFKERGTLRSVLGIEPNREVHAELAARAKRAGLDGTYEIVPRGIQQIGLEGIQKGSVDCIVSLLCLCSIPEPEKNTKELYQYLRPGGRWYLYEHVRVRETRPYMRRYQAFVNNFWPHALNGCQLCRDTGATLRRAGPWTTIDIAQPAEEQWFGTVPHIFGTLVK